MLDRYRLHRRLGAGAFGTVWMARDERLERDVAVKLLARERVLGGRFEREARAAARLAHPAIVTLYEAAVDDEGAYLVSELVRGSTLDTLLDTGQLSDRDIVVIAIALCDALEHAHGRGVVHRDVKPSNVLVPEVPASPAQIAKLTDFGVARVLDSDSVTATGDVLGTLAYMAPEQAEGQEVGSAADLYSLALVIYEALTGINPVRASTAFQRSRRLGAHLPPLRRQRRDLPAELGRALDRALRPRPRDRGTVAQLRDALTDAHAWVGDEPGVVTGAWTALPPAADQAPGEAFATRSRPGDAAEADRVDLGADGSPRSAWPTHVDSETDRSPRSAWPTRALGALGAAGFATWTAQRLLGSPAAGVIGWSGQGWLLAFAAGVAVLLAPRLGWLGLTAALSGAAVLGQHPGGALVIALAGLAPVVLLPGRARAWPLAAGAPALGLIGLAGAWPALAARAGGIGQRAALGAIGWLWLALAGAVLGRGQILYLPLVGGVAAPAAWSVSLPAAIDHLLAPLASGGVWAPAGVWALAAVTGPWLVRGRSVVLDVARALAWSALVLGATSAAVLLVHGTDAVGAAPTAELGAAAGAAVLLLPLGLSRWRRAWRSPSDVWA